MQAMTFFFWRGGGGRGLPNIYANKLNKPYSHHSHLGTQVLQDTLTSMGLNPSDPFIPASRRVSVLFFTATSFGKLHVMFDCRLRRCTKAAVEVNDELLAEDLPSYGDFPFHCDSVSLLRCLCLRCCLCLPNVQHAKRFLIASSRYPPPRSSFFCTTKTIRAIWALKPRYLKYIAGQKSLDRLKKV